MTKILQLDLPPRERPGREAFDSTPQHIKNWLANLPMANVEVATSRLCTALDDMNRQDLDDTRRFKALELMLPVVEYLAGEMKRHFAGKPLPLSEPQAKNSDAAQRLAEELAIGYKIIAVRQANANLLQQDKKLLCSSLYRAMEWSDFVLLKSYQTYMSYPSGLWSELNRMYAYAYLHKLSSPPVPVIPAAALRRT